MVGRVRLKGQLTIPLEVRERANLKEGSIVEFEVTDEGILMRPKTMIDAEDAWFWTKEWQERERDADRDIAAGRIETVHSDEELFKILRGDAAPPSS